MSDQPVSQSAVQPASKPLDPEEIVAELIEEIPQLKDVKDKLVTVVKLYIQYPAAPKPVDLNTALDDLSVFGDMTPKDVLAYVSAIDEVVQGVARDLADDFQTVTGQEIDPDTLDISGRVQSEIDEQKLLDNMARDLRQKVMGICSQLVLADLWLNREQEKGKQPEKKLSFGDKIFSLAIEKGLLERKADDQVETEGSTDDELDWLTPPVLSVDDPQFAKNLALINRIKKMIEENANDPNMKEIVLTTLANLGRDKVFLEDFLDRLSQLAAEQLAQSATILNVVGEDQANFQVRIKAINDLRQIYFALLRYFSPTDK